MSALRSVGLVIYLNGAGEKQASKNSIQLTTQLKNDVCAFMRDLA